MGEAEATSIVSREKEFDFRSFQNGLRSGGVVWRHLWLFHWNQLDWQRYGKQMAPIFLKMFGAGKQKTII